MWGWMLVVGLSEKDGEVRRSMWLCSSQGKAEKKERVECYPKQVSSLYFAQQLHGPSS